MWNNIDSQGVCGLPYDEEKLISAFCIANFSTRKTALEIIKTFESAGKIIVKDGKIYSLRYFNPDCSVRKEIFAPETPEQEAQRAMDNILGKEDASHDKILEDLHDN